MRVILLAIFFLSTISASAQQAGKVYYNYTLGGLMGGSETLIIPEDNYFILQKIERGFFGHTITDTLEVASEGLKGKNFDVHFTEKGVIVQSKRYDRTEKPRKYKEYDLCDSFVNRNRNFYYLNRLRYEAERLANEKIGRFNEEWQARPLLLTDLASYSISDYCHNEFKTMADSVHQIELNLISSILEKKRLRKERFMSEAFFITTESISRLLPELDQCRTDQELFIYLAEKEPQKVMEAIEELYAGNDMPWYQVTFEPSLPIYFLSKDIDITLAKQNLLSITPKSKSVGKMLDKIQKYWN